jgi:hypothetical protein
MANENPDVTITMTVDVSNLLADSLAPRWSERVKDYVTLTDTLGDTNDVSGDSSTFDTKTISKATIAWKAQSSNGVDSIHITAINPFVFNDPGKTFFDSNPEELKDGSELWVATAVDVEDEDPFTFEYSIFFYVNGDSKTVYKLDPKLQIKKSGD